MKNSKKLIYIKDIIIWRNVNWCGKWNSNYSLYEFVFLDFVIDFIKENNLPHSKLLIKQKNNSFIKKLRRENYAVVTDNIVFDFDGLLFFKLYLDIVYYTYKFDYVLNFDNNKFSFDFVFVYNNIILFTYKKNMYVLNNTVPNFDWNDVNFSDNFLLVLKNSEFPLIEGKLH